MILWFILGALLLATLALLLLPLLRRPRQATGRLAHELEVFRDQLAEVERDRERGIVSADEARQARMEIERRILRAGERHDAERTRATGSLGLVTAGVLAVVVPAVAAGVYVRLGSPWEPDAPLAARALPAAAPAAAQADGGAAGGVAEMTQKLEARLLENPDDLQGWTLLARSYWELRRFDQAAEAYRRAALLEPGNADLLMAMGEAFVYVGEGMVTPQAKDAFEKALAVDGRNAGARYYLALAEAQAGRSEQAYERWLALARDTPADAPWLSALRRRLEETGARLGRDVKTELPAALAQAPAPPPAPAAPAGPAPSSGMPQPTQEDVKAAMEMSEEDRAAFVRSMVERLADRLEQNPDDFDGWMRLGRAYSVLGERAKAQEAWQKAAALRPDDPAVRAVLGGAAPAPAPTAQAPTAQAPTAQAPSAAPPPGAPPPATSPPGNAAAGMPQPSQQDVQAAMQMSEEDRAAFVRGMVERLSTRLQENPDDFEGWLRLGRSQLVLGDGQAAKASYDRALALKPEDPEALHLAARAALETAGSGPPTPAAIALYRRLLAVEADQPEALFFAGIGDMQGGDRSAAIAKWERLLAMLDPTDPNAAVVRQQIEAAKRAP